MSCLLCEGLETGDELSQTVYQAVLDEVDVPHKPWFLGNYEILDQIGCGGMNTKSIQRVIIAQPGFQFSAGEKRDDPRSNSDNHSASRRHISASRRDDHEPADRTRTKTEDARFSTQCVFKHVHPAEEDAAGLVAVAVRVAFGQILRSGRRQRLR